MLVSCVEMEDGAVEDDAERSGQLSERREKHWIRWNNHELCVYRVGREDSASRGVELQLSNPCLDRWWRR